MQEDHRQSILRNSDTLALETDNANFEKILNQFVQKGLLNDHMVNKIRGCDSDLEKKKRFYEMVTKRGPNAFEILTETLTDVGLHNLHLMLKSNRLHRPSDTDGCCLSETKPEIYLLNSKPKGYVLIINIYDLIGQPNKTRRGSEFDVERLKKEFERRNFLVIVEEGFLKEEFIKYIKKFTQKDELKKIDSFFLFVMTHGLQDQSSGSRTVLQMRDGLIVESEWILDQFNSINCKNLAGKPKIIVFQACRGGRQDRGVGIQTDGGTFDNPLKKVEIMPTVADLLIVYSTLPGYVAERDPNKGAFFIQLWCDILKEGQKSDIFDMLAEVSRRLREKFKNQEMNSSQGLNWENRRFDKKFYF